MPAEITPLRDAAEPTPGRLSAYWLSLALTLVLALFLLVLTTRGHIAYTMDSLTYRDAAWQILQGHALQVTNVSMSAASQGLSTLPLLQWPPAFPLLWAGLSALTGIPLDGVPAVLNPLLLGLWIFALYQGCWTISRNAWLSGGLSLALLVSPVGLLVFGHAWSETLFQPLVMLAAVALLRGRAVQMPGRRYLWWMLAALLVGVANWTRYTGAIFLPLLALGILLLAPGVWRQRLLPATLGLGLSLLVVAPLWLRNYFLAGNISGSARGGMADSLVGRLGTDVLALPNLLLWPFSPLGSHPLVLAGVGLILVVVLVLVWRSTPGGRIFSPEASVFLLWALGNLGFLLFGRVVQSGIDLDYRMLAIPAPFLLLALAPGLAAALGRPTSTGRRVLVAVPLVLLVLAGGLGLFTVRGNISKGDVPHWPATPDTVYSDLGKSAPMSRFLTQNLGGLPADTLIVTDLRALYLRYLTGTQAFQAYSLEECQPLVGQGDSGILLITRPESQAWAETCLKAAPGWTLLGFR